MNFEYFIDYLMYFYMTTFFLFPFVLFVNERFTFILAPNQQIVGLKNHDLLQVRRHLFGVATEGGESIVAEQSTPFIDNPTSFREDSLCRNRRSSDGKDTLSNLWENSACKGHKQASSLAGHKERRNTGSEMNSKGLKTGSKKTRASQMGIRILTVGKSGFCQSLVSPGLLLLR
jgi:hypothetical protein